MGAHDHDHGHDAPPASLRTRRLLAALLGPLALATLIGLAVLWPGDPTGPDIDLGVPAELVDGRVVSVEEGPCEGTLPEAGIVCLRPEVLILEGVDRGETILLPDVSAADDSLSIEPGDRIVLGRYPDAPPDFRYSFADRERDLPLLVLAVLFAAAVVALGRWMGLRALLGVGISLAVLGAFILPAILEGSSPLAVALVGSGLIAFVSIYLAHGFNARSSTALVGTLVSLALVGLLGWVFVDWAAFTGLADDEATFLQLSASRVNLQGLLLGGIVIGTLGVLDDVTVTQASAVWELRRANPAYKWLDLYRAGLRIGRDHIAAAVNTLVLAYAGASLTLFLLFTQAQQRLVDVAAGEMVAVEIVRTLVGSIGLIASVPITTALAAVVVTNESPRPLGDPRRFRSRRERELWAQAEDDEV
jgi:uncharacterized membrane protein